MTLNMTISITQAAGVFNTTTEGEGGGGLFNPSTTTSLPRRM